MELVERDGVRGGSEAKWCCQRRGVRPDEKLVAMQQVPVGESDE